MPIWMRAVPLVVILFSHYVFDQEFFSENIINLFLFFLFSHWYLVYVGIQYLAEGIYTEMAYVFFIVAGLSFVWSLYRMNRRRFYKTDAGKEYLRKEAEHREWETETARKIRFIRYEWYRWW